MELTPIVVLRNLAGWLLITGLVMSPLVLLAFLRWRSHRDTILLRPFSVGLAVFLVSWLIRFLLFRIEGFSPPLNGFSPPVPDTFDYSGTWIPEVAPFLLAAVCALVVAGARRLIGRRGRL